jgi:hypothetical protein
MSGKIGDAQTMVIKLTVIKVGDGFLGFAVVNGVRVAGGRRATAYEAAVSLFGVLAGISGDNSQAALAIELGLAGVDMSEIPTIGDGNA